MYQRTPAIYRLTTQGASPLSRASPPPVQGSRRAGSLSGLGGSSSVGGDICRAFRVAAATAAVAEGWGGVVDGGDGDGDGDGCGKSVEAILAAMGKAMVQASQSERLLAASYSEGDFVTGELPLMLAFLEQVALTVDVLLQLALRISQSGKVRRGACCTRT